MSVFQRSLCLFFSVLLTSSLSFSEAMARRDKRPKVETPVVQVMPESKVMGLARDQALALLGAPSFKRSENGAEVWQYSEAGCVLNIFLFEKPPEPGLRVQYLDVFAVHPKQGADAADERLRCLRVFTDRPTATPTPVPVAPAK